MESVAQADAGVADRRGPTQEPGSRAPAKRALSGCRAGAPAANWGALIGRPMPAREGALGAEPTHLRPHCKERGGRWRRKVVGDPEEGAAARERCGVAAQRAATAGPHSSVIAKPPTIGAASLASGGGAAGVEMVVGEEAGAAVLWLALQSSRGADARVSVT